MSALAAPRATTTPYGSISGLRLRSPLGKPCLDYRSITRKEVVVDKMFDHIVSIENSCSKAIDVKLCYRNSASSCKNFRLAGYEKRSVLLGVMYNVSIFAFDYEEAFSR